MAAIKVWATVIVILRILTVISALASIAILFSGQTITDIKSIQGDEVASDVKLTSKDIIAYRYMLAVNLIAAIYCLLQLGIVVYYAFTKKSLMGKDFLAAFTNYGDRVIAILLATGVAAGFLVTSGLRDFFKVLYRKLGGNLKYTTFDDFFNKAYQSAALLTGAFAFMAFLLVCSSFHQKTKTAAAATTTTGEKEMTSDNFELPY